MNPLEGLALRDIHLPEPVSWWPPAAGWWLSFAVVIGSVLLITWLIKKMRQPVLKKRAIEQLRKTIDSYQLHGDKQLLVQQLSMVVRRIVISYGDREKVAAVTGVNWWQAINSLDEKKSLPGDMIKMLTLWPYQKDPQISDQDIEQLISQLQNWSRSLARDNSHA